GVLPQHKITPLLASEQEIAISKQIYRLYLAEINATGQVAALSPLPTEESRNWQYFYWKARHLARHGHRWASLSNFMVAMSLGGNAVAEVHF
ncbi:hypothetical protein WAI91_20935, partial [Acinetobacter baumannii]